ncbi:polysaccharide biosynthesis tyrosine autokinase [Thiothrix subterranea]|uniref:non-specific protein-tyrosine kinase n=1 Tax=Thiothrix subterranea TaxID=2735563 RepID=A0AA51ML42_9GAMM|nr:polysaccharide biosynthesis tyrosine autokinase [Thiothrix subterranea]MDQ5770673.1 polysaccharide biosynthesis tyrosine autokinase [Thiothrix subterranea]WML85963.1 polysaccharide biosynthesis tyrosine autokinase [Thiothrix subterranea]
MRNEQYNNQTSQTQRAYASDVFKKSDTLNLREFGRTLVRRKRMILLIIAITLLLTLLFTLFSKPLYRATATLHIERESSKVVDFDTTRGSDDIRDTRDFYQTQFELIRSRGLATQVIKDLNLAEELSSTSLIGQIKAQFSQPSTDNPNAALEDLFLDNLSIEPVKNSRLVAVSYVSPDPVQAAEIANAVVDTFKTINGTRRLDSTMAISSKLKATVDALKAQMDTAEEALQTHMRKHNISEQDGIVSTPTLKALEQRNDELSRIRQQRTDQESQNATLTDDKRQLNLEALDALKREESALVTEIDTTKQTQDEIINTYRTLQQEFFDQKERYKPLKKRLGEVSIAGSLFTDNIAVIDKAEVPSRKFKPNLSTNLLFGSLLGLLLGMSAAFMREFLDDTVKDINELERTTQLPVLAVMAETTDINSRQLATATISKPRSAIAEAFRSLRTSLRLTHQGAETPVIVITSASPDEGKTTTASNLACAYASAGNRVLLIDADMRNPSLHKTLGIHAKHGLSNYLSGALNSRDLIQITDIPNLYLLTAGSLPDDPAELLSSPHMRVLLDSAKQDFDQIIVDSPPVLGLADALILASQSSATLLTVCAEHTRMAILQNALTRLRRAQAPLAGILLNRVDLNNGYGEDYGGYVYQADVQRAKPTAVSKWLSALKKL